MADTKPSVTEKMLALLIISVVSLFGFISNGLSLHITATNSHFRNAYGTLFVRRFSCIIYKRYQNSRELSSQTSPIALISGCFANVSFYGSLLVNLLIAVNRYCKLLLISLEPCTLIFNIELDLRWSYSNTSCGYTNSMFDLIFTDNRSTNRKRDIRFFKQARKY
uniref:7TM GPCR serpentine receptor class x (Srx) domain-containing protein n=1 Tax=Wuchereria bancrofti TaxID=6293 RepID=A0AAF5PNT5_WUCBA